MLYSNPKAISSSTFTSFRLFRALVPFGARGPNWDQIPQMMIRETWKVIESFQLIISHQLMRYSNQKAIWKSNFICFRVFGALVSFGTRSPNRAQIPQMTIRETWKVIQSFQVIISHQLMPYSNPKAIWRSTFTCFRVFGALVQFGEIGPKWGPNTAIHG